MSAADYFKHSAYPIKPRDRQTKDDDVKLPRYSLRCGLIGFTAACVLLSVGAAWMRRARSQSFAATSIETLGGRVFYDYQLENVGGRVTQFDVRPSKESVVRLVGVDGVHSIGGVWYPRILDDNRNVIFQCGDTECDILRKLTGLRYLIIDSSSVTDKGGSVVSELRYLEDVSFNSPRITDVTLRRLSANRRITAISARGTSVTDDGVVDLVKLPDLKVLDLSFSKITPTSLTHIGKLRSLLELHLRGTALRGSNLEDLYELQNLKTLDLRECGLSNESIKRLAAAIPGTAIYE